MPGSCWLRGLADCVGAPVGLSRFDNNRYILGSMPGAVLTALTTPFTKQKHRSGARISAELKINSEGFNGYAKDANHESIEDAGRRIRGIAAQTILLAFQLAHANRRKIAAWADKLPDPGTGRPRRRPGPRRVVRLKSWTPKGYVDPPNNDELDEAA